MLWSRSSSTGVLPPWYGDSICWSCWGKSSATGTATRKRRAKVSRAWRISMISSATRLKPPVYSSLRTPPLKISRVSFCTNSPYSAKVLPKTDTSTRPVLSSRVMNAIRSPLRLLRVIRSATTSPAMVAASPLPVGCRELIRAVTNCRTSFSYWSMGWPVKNRPRVSRSPLRRVSSFQARAGFHSTAVAGLSSTAPNISMMPAASLRAS